ncbi:zinc finger protein-like [Tropilaelaps mercedesae]|uniref:Zinc finger protein-like n=1 Tax=Tropilaelaps mercedesae TaxID=418985 RepID=A0A1V9XVF4_9ACAR|nr:zinc finger protein-like [Tropilaelaps mercedesae]
MIIEDVCSVAPLACDGEKGCNGGEEDDDGIIVWCNSPAITTIRPKSQQRGRLRRGADGNRVPVDKASSSFCRVKRERLQSATSLRCTEQAVQTPSAQPNDEKKLAQSVDKDDRKFNSTLHCVGGGRQTDGVYYCALCDYQHKLYTTIRDHYYRLHAMSPPSLRCTLCSKIFLRSERLQDHIRAKHTGEKPYECRICEKSFASSAARAMHVKSAHRGRHPLNS